MDQDRFWAIVDLATLDASGHATSQSRDDARPPRPWEAPEEAA
jgi:hypothetical protein